MAIATLALCYNNYSVFQGVVKIRKGLAVSLMMEGTSMDSVFGIFERHMLELKRKINPADPTSADTLKVLKQMAGLLADARAAGTYTLESQTSANDKTAKLTALAVVAATAYATHCYLA